MSIIVHRRIIHILLSLYVIATWSSMAAMEIIGWTTVAFTLLYAFRKPADEPVKPLDFRFHIPWKAMLLLFAIVIIGFIVNGQPNANWVFGIGSNRWIFFFPIIAYAFVVSPPTLKGYKFFLIFTSVVAVYAVFQSVTGIDFFRSNHRAVQPLNLKAEFDLWRSAGLFGSPLQYAYIAGLHVCLPLAFVLLAFEKRKQHKQLWRLSLAAYCLITLSLITTFTRGAWIAMALAHLTIAWLASPRFAGALLGLGAVVTAGLFAFVDIFRVRLLTLFDPNFASNSERVFLWRANLEMFRDYPIFGIGYSENERRAKEYVAKLGNPEAFTGHAHNNYLQMLAGTGITGLLTYLFIIGFMLWLNWRLWIRIPKQAIWARSLALAAIGAQIHLHVGGFTECNFKAGVTSHNFFLIWSLLASMSLLLANGLLEKKYATDLG